MLKKIFFAAIMSVFVIVGGQISSCNATMPYNQMYLGGITVGSSYSTMVRMYGKPVHDEGNAENNYSCRYGNSVQIGYNNYSDKICSVVVSADNGWKTPAGLAVGMNISNALDMYGEPDYKTSGSFKNAYCYFHMKNNRPDYGFIILFNKSSGKILKMWIYGGVSGMVSFEENYQYVMEDMVK